MARWVYRCARCNEHVFEAYVQPVTGEETNIYWSRGGGPVVILAEEACRECGLPIPKQVKAGDMVQL